MWGIPVKREKYNTKKYVAKQNEVRHHGRIFLINFPKYFLNINTHFHFSKLYYCMLGSQ